MSTFDLIIIGGGPGGYPLAARMARKGWKVALIEEDNVGGTCLNWGCIPTKALLASAKGLHFLQHAEQWGLACQTPSFSWEKIISRKNEVVGKLRIGIEKLLEKHQVTFFKGHAQLLPDKKVRIGAPADQEISGSRICLAIGSKPWSPANFPKDKEYFWSSDEAIFARSIPERLLVIGGGVIGLELGQVFGQFGAKVTIVEMMSQILPGLDTAVAKRLLPVFKKIGMEIQTDRRVETLAVEGKEVAAVINGEKRLFDRVLFAMGRRPNLSVFEHSGLPITLPGNFIGVNEQYETSIPGIFAIGDCIPGPMLAHKASYDASILAAQWLGENKKANYQTVPACVYTYPEIAWVGLSEEQAQAQALPYKVGRFMFSANGKALASGEADGQVKTLVSPEGKLLGAVLWGPEVSNLIIEPTIIKGLDIGLHQFSQIIHPHPTLSEVFQEGFENALGEGVHG